MTNFAVLLFLAIAALTSSAQNNAKVTKEFEARQQAQDEAEDERDFAALDRFFTDDFLFTAANGAVYDKKKFLDELKADNTPPTGRRSVYEDFKVRVYGKMALENYVLVVPVKDKDGKETTNRYRMSVVWLKQDRDWRITNFHATRLRKLL